MDRSFTLDYEREYALLKSEVDKYKSMIDDTRHEKDCLIAEYTEKIKNLEERTIADFLPDKPIAVAEMLIDVEVEYEHNPLTKGIFGTDKGTYRLFDISDLRQMAEHLLVYCNHNEDRDNE